MRKKFKTNVLFRRLKYYFKRNSIGKRIAICVAIFILVLLLYQSNKIRLSSKSRAEQLNTQDVAAFYAHVDMSEQAGAFFSEGEEGGTRAKDNQTKTALEIDGSIHNKSLVIEQAIPVVIGISMQVVKEHCDGSDDTRIIRPDTMRCQKVEDLALRDFNEAQKSFAGTGKDLTFDRFDSVWDQSVNQNCWEAPGGQHLPVAACSADSAGYIYLSFLYVKDAKKSGGGEKGNIAMVIAPSLIRERNTNDFVDMWENSNSGDFISPWVTTHEIGHAFGQNHFSQLIEVKNYLEHIESPNVDVPVWYENDLYSSAHEASFRNPLWARLITAWCDFPKGSEYCEKNRYKYIPDNITLRFIKDGEEKGFLGNKPIFILYTDSLRIDSGLTNDSRILAGEILFNANGVPEYQLRTVKETVKQNDIFYGIIEAPQPEASSRYFVFWFTSADLNVLYDRGEKVLNLQLRERKRDQLRSGDL